MTKPTINKARDFEQFKTANYLDGFRIGLDYAGRLIITKEQSYEYKNIIRCVPTLVRNLKNNRIYYREYKQYFNNLNEFKEFILVLKLSGVEK